MTRTCEACGEPYEGQGKRFCSKPCAGPYRWKLLGHPWPVAEFAYLTPEQRKVWYLRIRNAFSRCSNPRDVGFRRYGGRGVKVCRAWAKAPLDFLRYGLALPGALDLSLSLDRIDNDRGYEPGNLRMATKSEQMRNRPHYKGGCEPRPCRGCEKSFIPELGRGYKKFCTRKCYLKWHRRK